jgi:hypothetical protein
MSDNTEGDSIINSFWGEILKPSRGKVSIRNLRCKVLSPTDMWIPGLKCISALSDSYVAVEIPRQLGPGVVFFIFTVMHTSVSKNHFSLCRNGVALPQVRSPSEKNISCRTKSQEQFGCKHRCRKWSLLSQATRTAIIYPINGRWPNSTSWCRQ